jgi:hypothetical protein
MRFKFVLILGLLTIASLSSFAQAQGLFQGAREGAHEGSRAAGPVGAVVGGAVGAGVGTVNGALGIRPGYYHHRRRCLRDNYGRLRCRY